MSHDIGRIVYQAKKYQIYYIYAKTCERNTFKEKYNNLPQSSFFIKHLQENFVVNNPIKIFTMKTNRLYLMHKNLTL